MVATQTLNRGTYSDFVSGDSGDGGGWGHKKDVPEEMTFNVKPKALLGIRRKDRGSSILSIGKRPSTKWEKIFADDISD